jgi:tetratricopeptide (TPR) repeat protein
MNVQEKLTEIKRMRFAKRFDEAIENAKYIIAMDKKNADAWWNLALAQHSSGKLHDALSSLKTVLKLAPRFASGWAQYGVVLAANSQPDEGLKALSHALQLDPLNSFAAAKAADLCRDLKDADGEIHYLTRLDAMGKANGNDLNRLGIAYWEKKHFGKAIDYYHRSASVQESCAPYFNLALVYNHDEVSQDADAIDSLERALWIDPDYDKATKRLAAIKPRLEKLARDVLNGGESGLGQEDWYQFYLNPFEVLGADREDDLEDYDAKRLQKLKKRLLQEIELEDGRIDYLDGLTLDRSRAIGICEELNDESLKEYHWLVFTEPYLLGFLTRGEIRHFLCLDGYKPLELLDELDSEWSGFREWLSLPFARQYDLVLTRALQRKCVSLVESLFDGRRWILREHEERCFEGGKRQVEQLLAPLRQASESAKELKPNPDQIKRMLHHSNLVSIINLLPEPFRDRQSEAVNLIRCIAISSFNIHGDTDLSKEILTLSQKFSFKSAALTQRLAEDFKQIEKLIAQERKHEAKLTLGTEKLQITKDGVRQGSTFIPADRLTSIRWGTLITGTQYSQTHQYLLVCRDSSGSETTFSWKSSSNLEQQQEHFSLLVNAAINYVIPSIVEKMLSRINSGQGAKIGPCTLSKGGLSFEKAGWFNSKTVGIPWARVKTDMVNGMLVVSDKSSPKMRTEMSIRDTENAVLLHYFQGIFK